VNEPHPTDDDNREGITMTDRTVSTITLPEPQPGTGILHPFPTRELPHLDPFVFLDAGAPKQMHGGDIFVGPHPHRGVQPVSLVFRARIEHRDSVGNHRTVTSGGMQWLVAGSGALHEEVLNGDDDGIFHMAQLWVNVPADQKMNSPEHHAVPPEEVPLLDGLADGVQLRLFAGELAGRRGPAPLATPVLIAHIALAPGSAVTVPVDFGWTVGACVVAGSADVAGHAGLPEGATPVFADDGDAVTFGSTQGGEILLMAGQPIGEPIAMGGGFVMNTRDEIEQAFDDYRAGAMGTLTASR
jgi:redox-sensitive bicupin YhaK (pirin superfamily)